MHDHHITWLELKSIPNLINAQGLLAETPKEKLAEFFEQWVGIIDSFSHWSNQVRMALRVGVDNQSSCTRIFWGISSDTPEKNDLYRERLIQNLEPLQLRLSLVEDKLPFPSELEKDACLLHLTQNLENASWSGDRTDEEIAQRERQYQFSIWQERNLSTLQSLYSLIDQVGREFRATSNNKQSLWVTTYMEPTVESENEKKWCWYQRELKRNRDLVLGGDDTPAPNQGQSKLNSEGLVFDDLINRLKCPTLGLIEVACHSSSSSHNSNEFANRVANLIRGSLEAPLRGDNPNKLEDLDYGVKISNPAVLFPNEDEAWQLASETFSNLKIRFWTFSNTLPKEAVRLPYIHSSSSIAQYFRLPCSWNEGVSGVRMVQPLPDYLEGGNQQHQSERMVFLGRNSQDQDVSIPMNDLKRHALIVGNTGSGKSTTIRHILRQIHQENIPYLILEAGKSEYRELLVSKGFEEIQLFTPGLESISPLYINPFELLPGVSLEAHIGRLQQCLEATLPLGGPLQSIVEEGLVKTYTENGWESWERGSKDSNKAFPTMSVFRAQLEIVAENRGYQGEVRSNVKAAIDGRVRALTKVFGVGRGRMLDTQLSMPSISTLLERPTIMELNHLRQEDKSLVMMLMMMFLREYRETKGLDADLKHLLLIEEAHNVIANVKSEGGGEGSKSDIRFKAVESFGNLLSELRSYGQGVIIADQSPNKLLPEAIKNTNLQIAHQLRSADDRDVMASCMVMSPEQESFLPKLGVGQALVYFSGREQAGVVRPKWDGLSDTLNETRLRVVVAAYLTLDEIRAFNHPLNWETFAINTILRSSLREMGNFDQLRENPDKLYHTAKRHFSMLSNEVLKLINFSEDVNKSEEHFDVIIFPEINNAIQ